MHRFVVILLPLVWSSCPCNRHTHTLTSPQGGVVAEKEETGMNTAAGPAKCTYWMFSLAKCVFMKKKKRPKTLLYECRLQTKNRFHWYWQRWLFQLSVYIALADAGNDERIWSGKGIKVLSWAVQGKASCSINYYFLYSRQFYFNSRNCHQAGLQESGCRFNSLMSKPEEMTQQRLYGRPWV